jgi:hypothetical protein
MRKASAARKKLRIPGACPAFWGTVISNKPRVLSGMLLLLGSSAYAAGTVGCDVKLTASLHECERIVGSLRADKAGQMRVFAPDGSEFTAEQATWLKAQLRLIARACSDGDAGAAARRLAEVQDVLKRHHRPSQS